jgi:hypothetical protein
MSGKTIGRVMPNGFAGSYARQPDMIIDAHPLGGSAAVNFGAALVYSAGKVVPAGAATTAADFAGIAAKEIKSALNYLDQSTGR